MTLPYIGREVQRVGDRQLLHGGGQYIADVNRPRQVWARVVRSQVAHADIAAIHVDEARELPGVVSVITARDIPHIDRLRIPIRLSLGDPGNADAALQPPLAIDRVRYVGEPIAVVVAEDPHTAEDAAETIWADVAERPPLPDPTGAYSPDAVLLHESLSSNVAGTFRASFGEPFESVSQAADLVLHRRLTVGRQTGVPLETRGLVAELDDDTGRLTVWGAAKVKQFNLATLAWLLDLPRDLLRLVEVDVGGGFGVRGEFYPEDYLVPWLALQLRRPVKWVEDRVEHLVATNHSREQVYDLDLAVNADGTLLGLRSRSLYAIGAYVRTTGLIPAQVSLRSLAGLYGWKSFDAEVACVLTNVTPAGTYRGPGEFEAAFAREVVVDLAAKQLGLDPAQIRLMNLLEPHDGPIELPTGEGNSPLVYEQAPYGAYFGELLEKAGYPALIEKLEKRRRQGECVGLGLACFGEESGFGPHETARIVPTEEGGVTVLVGVASVGQGVRTALTQIAADHLGVPMDAVHVSYEDTDLVKEGWGAFASRTTVVAGNAVALAAADYLVQARARVAEELGVAEEEVEVLGGIARRRGDPTEIALASLGVEGAGRFEHADMKIAFGGQLAVVTIDVETGHIAVEKYVAAHDIGTMINPAIVRGQLIGGAVQGIGGALSEELHYDTNGQPTTAFADYLVLTSAEAPTVELIIFEHPGDNPLGAKPAGESSICGTGAAIANAVANATGHEVTHVPVRLPTLRNVLGGEA